MNKSAEFFEIPSYCPVCGADSILDGQFLFCRSKSCPVQLTGSVKVWVKRLGLLHWGDSLIESLTDPGNPKVRTVADLYRLSVDDISEHCSGVKVAKKCHSTLMASRSMTLDTMIASLNIVNLATTTAAEIVHNGFDTVEKLFAATASDLEKVPNVGPITAQSVVDGLKEKAPIIIDLCDVLDLKSAQGPLVGLSFCITGSTSVPRKALEKKIVDNGGTVKSSVGAGLKYLITNDSETTSTKMKKAKSLGANIITESQLYDIIGSES